jgi:hypothetical protein
MRSRYPQFNRRHAGALLFLLQNPGIKQKEAAAQLGYSEKWLSVIINSPAFRGEWLKALDRATASAVDRLFHKN